jgi:hypothetical protein
MEYATVYNIIEECRKHVPGKKTRVSPDVLLLLLADRLADNYKANECRARRIRRAHRRGNLVVFTVIG